MKRLLLFVLLFVYTVADAQKYWQQQVDTKIDVKLDDNLHMLHGSIAISYTNNSPDTLRFLYMHLWPNAYQHDHTPFAKQLEGNGDMSFYFAKADDRGYMDSLDFLINGESAELNIGTNAPDIGRLGLRKPVLPGETIKITTPFRVKVPIVFSRLGHSGQAYYISQWFPKPAVYDRRGWHPMSYLDMGEFYSEYGSYDVSITLPSNYVVMATGNCTDLKEQQWLDSLATAPLRDTTANTVVTSTTTWKTVHFQEDSVHDFAWFADKRWVVRKAITNNAVGQSVTAWAAYLPASHTVWKKATEHLTTTLAGYEAAVGGYAYKTIKAVQGELKAGGGMEYPTITVVEAKQDADLKKVIVHEAGHNWFYGMLGSNERDHPWMDEGLNSFYEKKTLDAAPVDSSIKRKRWPPFEDVLYYSFASAHTDQPIELTAPSYEKLNYGIDLYYKTKLMFGWLEQFMGEQDFKRGMRDYFSKWRLKHPQPADFRSCMQAATAKNLDWFFDGMMKTSKKIDFYVSDAKETSAGTTISIRNRSQLLAPVKIKVLGADRVLAEQWSEPFNSTTDITLPITGWRSIIIDSVNPDAKTSNNLYKRNALFHRFGIKPRLFAGLNRQFRDPLFLSPAIGYNQFDGLSAGLLLHNLTLPENKFRFVLAPMYSFVTNSFVGAGSVGYQLYPSGAFSEVLAQMDGKMFHHFKAKNADGTAMFAKYAKASLGMQLLLRELDPRSTRSRTFTVKGYQIMEESFQAGSSAQRLAAKQSNYQYGLVRYNNANERSFNPYSYTLEAHGNGDFGKLMAEGTVRVDYHKANKSLRVRAFIGKYLALNNDLDVVNKYKLNTSYSGVNDYLFDGTYTMRNPMDGRNPQQIAIMEGGFKIPVNSAIYRSDNWLASINLSTDLPISWLPIRLFFDAGATPNFTPTIKNNRSTTFIYDGGVEFHALRGMLTLYVPLIMSAEFRSYLNDTYGRKNAFLRQISATIDLQRINWLQSPSRAARKFIR
jgi:hypothetical protein